ncbi:hypothetical protein [Alteribacter aurantiacus]|uniref:hypothetical protein n=1 Tax=Alteribacter aurantiacus TaxID=254410 RepID=UPI0004062E81|nr:hypothetical protein [Alteribacter aurantiacus]
MVKKVTDAQGRFLESYEELLRELDDVLGYVSECYIKGDVDIADRLLSDVMKGMLPYHPENMTLVSIFGDDGEAMGVLRTFHECVKEAVDVEERFGHEKDEFGAVDTGDRMAFLHERLIRTYQLWRAVVVKKKGEWESSE